MFSQEIQNREAFLEYEANLWAATSSRWRLWKEMQTDDILEVMTFLKKNTPWQDTWTVIDRKHPLCFS